MEELPCILSDEAAAELQTDLQSFQNIESEENMLAKYIIARMFVHDHNHSVS